MLKAQVLRRNFSLFNRVPYSQIARSAARDGHESVVIQRVRIQRPFLSKSRLVGTVAVIGAFYGLKRYAGIEVEVGVVDEQDKKASHPDGQSPHENEWQHVGPEVDDEEDDDDLQDVLFFLPTGFSRPSPRKYYRGSDPEWQEFKRIATDRARVDKIRGELTTMIRHIIANSPSYVSRLGKIDTTKGKVWIEVKFPDSPPIEYVRPGYELTDRLEWRKSTRPVEEAHHHRLSKLLYPTAVTGALYLDAKRKTAQSWKDFRVYMGWEEKSESDTVQQMVQRVGASPSPSSSPAPSSTAAPNPFSTSPSNDTRQPAASPSIAPVDGSAKDFGFVLPDSKTLTLDLAKFQQDFQKASKPGELLIPRGALYVVGLVEVHGERARMTLNVAAAYDPKQGRYVGIRVSLWNHVEHRQIPRGGP